MLLAPFAGMPLPPAAATDSVDEPGDGRAARTGAGVEPPEPNIMQRKVPPTEGIFARHGAYIIVMGC